MPEPEKKTTDNIEPSIAEAKPEIKDSEPQLEVEDVFEKPEGLVEQQIEKEQILVKDKLKLDKELEVTPPPSSAKPTKQQVKAISDLDRSEQVKALCELAFEKGVDFAIEIAKKLDNAYVLDELHDSLVDELYKKLIEEDKLKKL